MVGLYHTHRVITVLKVCVEKKECFTVNSIWYIQYIPAISITYQISVFCNTKLTNMYHPLFFGFGVVAIVFFCSLAVFLITYSLRSLDETCTELFRTRDCREESGDAAIVLLYTVQLYVFSCGPFFKITRQREKSSYRIFSSEPEFLNF
jgi:hypothetical protein